VSRPTTDGGATLARSYPLVIFDLDGVIYLGTEPVAGAADAVEATVDGGTPVAFVTNNASRRAAEVGTLLRGMGVKARNDDVLTSAQASAELLASDLPSGSAVLVVGAPALRQEIEAVGLTAVDRAEARPLAVVQGYGPDVGWALLAEASVAIRAGAQWVATNTDTTMPSPRGPLPGNGSLVAALTTALGRGPDVVVGKPEPALFRLTAQHRNASRALVVGDRLDTDIEGANRADMAGLLVLTGVSTPVDVMQAPAARRPTYVAQDCRALSTSEDKARVPEWDGAQVLSDGWRVTHRNDRLELTGQGDDVAALRALAPAAWAHPDWTGIIADEQPAADAIGRLGLGRYVGWAVAR
jgi:HAD superfamily hydrolase (TIGR01450 family)